MAKNTLLELRERGQSVWLDFLSREFLRAGGLDKLIHDDGLAGVTSNPSIFQKAIGHGDAYDEQIGRVLASGWPTVTGVFEELAVADIRDAAFLGADPSEERQVITGFVVRPERARRQTMVDGADPVYPGERFPLRVGDGDQGHVRIVAEKQRQIRQVKPAVLRGQGTARITAENGKVQVIEVKVEDIKTVRIAKDGLECADVVRHGIVNPVPLQP
jgi:hypothetical protein